jgi:glutamine cyclotransferase
MKHICKVFIVTALVTFFISCGNESSDPNDYFGIAITAQKDAYTNSDALKVSLQNKKKMVIEKVSYFIDAKEVATSEENTQQSLSLSGQKMGIRNLHAVIIADGETYEVSTPVKVVASQTPKLYSYNILESYPHDINAFTQGLEFANDTLYESTGKRGKSTLRKTNYLTGEVLQQEKVADQFFAEGITILNDKIYQLTWQRNTGFVYDLATLKKTGSFVYNESKEGWGLCNDGTTIFKSDGTEKIWNLDPATLAEDGYIEIYTNKSKIPRVNELEWVEGKIYANIWQQNAIAIVDPASGAVEGVIDMKGLQAQVTQHKTLDVLNGIAYNGEPNILYVTGKNWDKLFKIEIVAK